MPNDAVNISSLLSEVTSMSERDKPPISSFGPLIQGMKEAQAWPCQEVKLLCDGKSWKFQIVSESDDHESPAITFALHSNGMITVETENLASPRIHVQHRFITGQI